MTEKINLKRLRFANTSRDGAIAYVAPEALLALIDAVEAAIQLTDNVHGHYEVEGSDLNRLDDALARFEP